MRAEQLVHRLAEASFLTDWCFPNPKLPNNKELCDLLVVYDDVAIIWQVKNPKLQPSGQYKQAEVDKNVRQLLGARRHLLDLPTPITLENPRRGPEAFDATSIKEIHLVSALMGHPESARTILEAHQGHLIHTLHSDSAEVLLNELSTLPDFLHYTRLKARLFDQVLHLSISGSELDLLAWYLTHQHQFSGFESATDVFLEPGLWNEYARSENYRAKIEADRISYGWDSIISRTHECSPDYETVARELARTTRLERRVLSQRFYDSHVKAHESGRPFQTTVIVEGKAYCFLLCDIGEISRAQRRERLGLMCYVARGELDRSKVIGIATEGTFAPECTYDFCVIDMPTWTAEDIIRCRKIKADTGMFQNPQWVRGSTDEHRTA